MNKDSCKHFCGFQHERCEAGVRYKDLTGGVIDGIGLRLPCNATLRAELSKHPDLTAVDCLKFERPTEEEVAVEEDAIRRAIERMIKIAPWVSSTRAKYPKGGSGTDVCPICRETIHFSVSSYNRHMRAQCEGKDCINFIE